MKAHAGEAAFLAITVPATAVLVWVTQWAIQVDLEMNQDTSVRHDRMLAQAELLDSAGRQALRTTDTRHLRGLIMSLEIACETARVATLQTLRDPGSDSGIDMAKAQRFGFADLFAALRRTRTEVARRTSKPRKRASPTSTKKLLGDAVA